jgi:hypothetical protein
MFNANKITLYLNTIFSDRNTEQEETQSLKSSCVNFAQLQVILTGIHTDCIELTIVS